MSRKAKVKKWIKRILIVIAVLLGLVWAVYDNLVSNSVYYAKYTPHKEGVEPQLMMVIEHLDDIYLPEMNEYRYDFDGLPSIQIYDKSGNLFIGYYSTSYNNKEIEYNYSLDLPERRFYTFNAAFQLIDITDTTGKYMKLDFTLEKSFELKAHLFNMLKPLIDAQPLPDVNLQWLFDWAYHDKFN